MVVSGEFQTSKRPLFLQLVCLRKDLFTQTTNLGMTRCNLIYLILWINMMQLDLPFNMEG